MELNIIFEDEYLIVCEKLAGIPSQSDKSMDYDMVNRLKNYIYENTGSSMNNKPPYVGLIHRLDRPVGGIMVFAKTPEAAKELSVQIQKKQFTKKYFAGLTGDFSSELNNKPMLLTDYITFNGRTNLSSISMLGDAAAKKAELYYQILGVKQLDSFVDSELPQIDVISLAQIQLLTGRHHQIRIQMQHNKGGLWGDSKYNPIFTNAKGWYQIALYAYYLSFNHPKTRKRLEFQLLPNAYPFDLFKQEMAQQ